MESAVSGSHAVAVLGAGMHPWGKWGRNFVDYGVVAARAALADAELAWTQIPFIAAGATMRNGYPGYVAAASVAQALGWQGAQLSTSYAACASGAQALQSACAQILSGQHDLALVLGADTTPKGFLAPQLGDRPQDPDWVRFRLGITNTSYFGMYARRRMARYGASETDFARVKVKNAAHGIDNPNARYRKACSVEQVLASPVVASPLRLLDICATSDGAAALVLSSVEFARRHGQASPVRIAAVSTATPRYASARLEMPDIATDSTVAAPAQAFLPNIAAGAYEQAGIGPSDLSLAEVYDLSTAMELDWYEALGLCAEGDAEALLRSGATSLGGRLPVNPSGGLACFGEAVPAQALAQTCELVWQLRGQAGARQVADAKVGIAVNQGLFGHGSAIVAVR